MQALLDWLNSISWGQYDVFKYIILSILIIVVFDIILSLASRLFFGFISGGRDR